MENLCVFCGEMHNGESVELLNKPVCSDCIGNLIAELTPIIHYQDMKTMIRMRNMMDSGTKTAIEAIYGKWEAELLFSSVKRMNELLNQQKSLGHIPDEYQDD